MPPIGEVFTEVHREESRRQIILEKKSTVRIEPVEGSALAIPEAQASQRSSQNQQVREKNNLCYDYYRKPRHTRENCYKLNGRRPNGRETNLVDRICLQKKRLNHLHSRKSN